MYLFMYVFVHSFVAMCEVRTEQFFFTHWAYMAQSQYPRCACVPGCWRVVNVACGG